MNRKLYRSKKFLKRAGFRFILGKIIKFNGDCYDPRYAPTFAEEVAISYVCKRYKLKWRNNFVRAHDFTCWLLND